MPEEIDPIAAAIASARGEKLVTEDAAADDNAGADDDKGAGDGTDGKEAAKDDDKKDDSSGGQDDNKASGTDQQGDKKIIPNSGKSDDGTDQSANFDTTLAERSGGRFKSMADIDKALEDAPQPAFASEQVAKLNEYVKGGGSLSDFARTQTVDYSTMSQIELIQAHRQIKDKDLTAEEIQIEMEEDFGVAEDASDRAKKLAGIKMKREGAEALGALQEHQSKWATPHQAANAVTREAQVAAWETQLNGAVDNVDNVTIALNQTDNFVFELEPEAKAKIKSEYRELDKFFGRYQKADGTEDTAKFVRDMAILDNHEAIIRAAASSSKSAGKTEVIKDVKNTDFKGDNKQGKEEAPLTIAAQAAKQFYGR